jgi:hypothetical protein
MLNPVISEISPLQVLKRGKVTHEVFSHRSKVLNFTADHCTGNKILKLLLQTYHMIISYHY